MDRITQLDVKNKGENRLVASKLKNQENAIQRFKEAVAAQTSLCHQRRIAGAGSLLLRWS